MARPRTAVQLVALLDRELSWRRTDLLFGLRLVNNATGDVDSAVRAAIPLLYAHWEGFIKRSSLHYSSFLSAQRLRFADVKTSLSGLRAQGHVLALADVKKKIFATSELVEAIRSIESERLIIPLGSHIDRLGNLNHEMLMQLVKFLGLPIENYVAFGPLIDEALLSHRNRIAHGEFLDVSRDRYREMHSEVVAVIERFKADLEDAATTKSYRRHSEALSPAAE
ncbi:MAE_28990/MAE_18760 family HEPN-like nuclease [uncultured Sphingomonas sp.]|uniref:MAE_28990/MAE_18760 family HEPN-like nuclease n=1 Tax=uncultured Sphingomonas sp. TaxID=158754 RepID=UPI0035CA9D17